MTNALKLNWRRSGWTESVTINGKEVASVTRSMARGSDKWAMWTIAAKRGRATGYIYESADEAKAQAEQELLNMARLIINAFAS